MAGPIYKVASITKKYGSNFIANILQQGLRFLVLYAAAKQLGPTEFGLISIVLLATGYLMNANLGAVNGLKRQIPLVYSGKGNTFIANAFFSVFNFNLIATFCISAAIAIVLYLKYDMGLLMSGFLVILSLSINIYFNVQAYFTSMADWKNLFKLQLLCAGLLALTLLSLFSPHPIMLLASYAGSFLLASLVLFQKHQYQLVFDKKIINENVTIGFPAMIAGFIFLLFQTTDRLIVSKFYMHDQFGYYSFAWTFVLAFNLLTNLSSEIILQKGAVFFSKNPDKKNLLFYLLKYSLLLELVLIAVAIPFMLVLQYAIPQYFPAYIPAVAVVRNITIAYLVQQLALAVANYYYIINRQLLYNILLATACLVNALVLLIPVLSFTTFPDIEYVSRLTIWSSCLYILILYCPFLAGIFRSRFNN
jgi:O-antigen/teichoic acid export membrane protein